MIKTVLFGVIRIVNADADWALKSGAERGGHLGDPEAYISLTF